MGMGGGSGRRDEKGNCSWHVKRIKNSKNKYTKKKRKKHFKKLEFLEDEAHI